MNTGNVRRRTLPPLALAALLLAGQPGPATAAPGARAVDGGVKAVGIWEWAWGWVAESFGIGANPTPPEGEEGGGIDPNGGKKSGVLLGEEGGGIDPNG